METLSRVMMPWDWIGMVTIRSGTCRRLSISGAMKVRPGSRVPLTRTRVLHKRLRLMVDGALSVPHHVTAAGL
jgi:hypothetical protein